MKKKRIWKWISAMLLVLALVLTGIPNSLLGVQEVQAKRITFLTDKTTILNYTLTRSGDNEYTITLPEGLDIQDKTFSVFTVSSAELSQLQRDGYSTNDAIYDYLLREMNAYLDRPITVRAYDNYIESEDSGMYTYQPITSGTSFSLDASFDEGKQIGIGVAITEAKNGEKYPYIYYIGMSALPEVGQSTDNDMIAKTVTFDANGHGTAPEDITNITTRSLITAPVAPTEEGFSFDGWYKDQACSDGQEWNFETDIVTAHITLYAKWIDNATTALAEAKANAKNELVSYKNKDDYREAQQTELENAIKTGNTNIDAATTVAEVNTALNNAKAEIDKIKTDKQLKSEEDKKTSGTVTTPLIAAKEGAPTTAQMTTSTDALMNASGVFTQAEKDRIANGTDAKVWLDIAAANATSDEKSKAEAVAKEKIGNNAKFQFLDLSLWTQVGSDVARLVPEPGIGITVTLKIPESIQNANRTYYIIRLHNGVADVLTGTLDKKYNYTFVTDRFSTYAIAYNDTSANNSNTDNDEPTSNTTSSNNTQTSPKTGDVFDARTWVLLMIAGLAGMIGTVVYKKKEKME